MESNPESLSLEQLQYEIKCIIKTNNDLISEIEFQKKNGKKIMKKQIQIKLNELPSHEIAIPYNFSCIEITNEINLKEFFENWSIPTEYKNLVDPDEDKILYGDNNELMSMKCENLEDLIRINQQFPIAMKYLVLLREKASISFGLKFKENFLKIQHLLKQIILDSKNFLKEENENHSLEIKALINEINEKFYQVFNYDILNKIPLFNFKIDSKILKDKMKKELYKMIPKDKRQSVLQLVYDNAISIRNNQDIFSDNENYDLPSFDRNVKGKGPFLVILKNTDNFIFGAYVADTLREEGEWIPGSQETFLFSFGNETTQNYTIKLLHNGFGNGIYITIGCGLHLSDDLVTFCSNSCSPNVYTKIADGYPNLPITNSLLAGNENWTPSLFEVFVFK